MSGYPVILGGDHAAFEAEWARSGRPDSERPDWPLPSFDALDWAKAFHETALRLGYSDMDEAWLASWFANALMRGYDERASKEQQLRVDVLPLPLFKEKDDEIERLTKLLRSISASAYP